MTCRVDLQGVASECNISHSNSSPCNSCMELASLENAVARDKRNINRSHSPFLRIIPPEIIATISGFANTDFSFIGRLPACILLSSVCSDWRKIVVGTPQLWSSIAIDMPPISHMPDSTLLRLATFIDEWLARSGQLPLYISFSVRAVYSTTERCGPIFKILNQYSSRWQNLNISVPPTFLPFFQPDCLPLLEQLHVTSYFTSFDYLHRYFVTFPPTPCLNTVEIRASTSSITRSPISIDLVNEIQWDTVTHVSVDFITTYSCFALLRRIPNLVHCTFHKVVDDIEDHLPESPVLSSLTYLSLHHQKSDPYQLLNNIKLPSLETLVLFHTNIDPVMDFLERSACSLHTLSLLNWNVQKSKELTRLLQFLSPSLTKLAISRSPGPICVTEIYLSILTQIYASQTHVAGNDFFLPHLEIFEYREESPSTLESFMLSNLPPQSRNYPKPATPISLRSAYINKASIINKAIPQDISLVLRHLQEDGILTYT